MALDIGYGKTYVWLMGDGANDEIVGYYNISTGYIENISDGGVRRYRLGGSVHINMFALDVKYQGIILDATEAEGKVTLADFLLDECLERIHRIREKHVGFSFVTLCSTDKGYGLYTRKDFNILEPDMTFTAEKEDHDCISMYLPLDYE